jgi:hypothetical protein
LGQDQDKANKWFYINSFKNDPDSFDQIHEDIPPSFNPKNFLMPHWQGNGLTGQLEQSALFLLKEVQKDVLEHYLSATQFNNSLKVKNQTFLSLTDFSCIPTKYSRKQERIWQMTINK